MKLFLPKVTPLALSSIEPLSAEVQVAIARAAKVISRAFIDDPLFMTWRGISCLEKTERYEAISSVFETFIRLITPLNHTFVAGGGSSYCICIPCWPLGYEDELCFSQPALYSHPLPPVEAARIKDITSSFIGKR